MCHSDLEDFQHRRIKLSLLNTILLVKIESLKINFKYFSIIYTTVIIFIIWSFVNVLKLKLLYDKVNHTCITSNVSFLNAYIMIPSHTGSFLSTHTTLFGWVILITMMSLDPRLRSCL